MEKIALVRLREAGNIMQFLVPFGLEISLQDKVIVEQERGIDYGEVLEISEEQTSSALRKIIRKMTPQDLKKVKENIKEAKDALKICARKIKEHRLKMKLIEAEYSFDKKKIIFYFTAEGRVDFRELVKDLAKIFKIRIEMRQVGVRDEARLFGGIGPCGRNLCCVTFLKNFEPVSIKMAKLQRLILNPSKISGICGRLMCCLVYEHKIYREFSRGLPKEGTYISTSKGKGKVIAVNVLKRQVYVELEGGVVEKVDYPLNE
ncbi:MAG: stage 0 sporulation protein [Candidatus Omnitrophica bacterium 4484_70.1]|nr:MAG: stage 0 sporulation protein [Candidatus Omnitrophica bacterium 4484_70.1]